MENHELTEEEIDEIQETFYEFDLDGSNHITCDEIGQVMKALGEDIPGYKLREIIEEVDRNKNGSIEFKEFLEIYKQNSNKLKAGSEFRKLISKKTNLVENSEGPSESSKHSYQEAEREAFVEWINTALKDDKEAKPYLPINPTDEKEVFEKIKDGIILCKMINLTVPNTIDERAVNKPQNGNTMLIKENMSGALKHVLIKENLELALNSARAIGCNIVNIGAEDIEKAKPHLVFGVMWQIIRIGLFANITSKTTSDDALGESIHERLPHLLENDETIEDLSPEEFLLRWFNYHLKEEGHMRRVTNFNEDIKDSECYTYLLWRISRISGIEHEPVAGILQEKDLKKRAEKMLLIADSIGCKKFVRPADVASGNTKLNMAFVANLFNTYPALLPLLSNEKLESHEDHEDHKMETREERTYRNWMNSIGVSPYVSHLYKDLSNGLVLLQIYDQIKPGTVSWDKVNRPSSFKQMSGIGGNMKKVENCNYAVAIGKDQMKFSLVSIEGKDIHDCNETLTLAIVWQQMRAYTISRLPSKPGGETMKEGDIVAWVNEKLKKAKKSSSISSFKDPTISTSQAVLDLVDAIKPGTVKYALVSEGRTYEERLENAKYALSVARKIVTTYALPDDLVEVKPKMVLTVFASLMKTATGKDKN